LSPEKLPVQIDYVFIIVRMLLQYKAGVNVSIIFKNGVCRPE
jgi:hypothetical protein